jgi:hypothetical protein
MKYRTKQNGNNLKYTFFMVCRSIVASMASSPILVGVSRTLVRAHASREPFPFSGIAKSAAGSAPDVL